MAVTDVGIDLGTSSILVYVRGRGVVLKEPSIAAYDRDDDKIRAIGEEARIQLSRSEGNLTEIHPLENGIIADYVVTEQMLRTFIQKAVGRLSFRKPRVCICIPVGLTEVERHAVEDAAYQAGARDVHMVEEPIAAAIGAGIDFSKPSGNMIVDIGGGSTSVAILSMDGIVVSTRVKIGGNDYDEALIKYIRNQFGVVIEKAAAEEIKMQVGTVYERPEEKFLEFIGRDIDRPSQEGADQLRELQACLPGTDRTRRGSGPQRAGEDTARTGFGCCLQRDRPGRRRMPDRWS